MNAPKESLSSEGEAKIQLVQANSAARALNILGDRWTLMVLHSAFFRVRRFDDFLTRIGLARSLLIDRLRRLQSAGVLVRARYQDRPIRYEYRLSEAGIDLYSVALTLIAWEKHWRYDPANPAHRIRHSCGHEFTPEFRCSACGEIVSARDIYAEAGPGATYEASLPPRAQRRSIVPSGSLNLGNPMLDRALQVLGDRWTAHIIAAAFMGHRRFSAFQDALGVATNILSDRLARLVDLGVLERRLYQERPQRREYRLTDVGRDLYPVIFELGRWGDRWLAGEAGPPLITYHRTCGHRLTSQITCDHCHRRVDYQDVDIAGRTP